MMIETKSKLPEATTSRWVFNPEKVKNVGSGKTTVNGSSFSRNSCAKSPVA